MTDDQMRDQVISQLHWDNRLGTAEISVNVASHSVRLEGVVPTYLAKKAALEDVMHVDGVLSVDDKTTIQHPTSVTRYSDEEIRQTIEEILHLNANIDSSRVDVEVQNGVVTVRGSVDAFWKKIRVEELILDMLHVVSVTNLLSVEPRHHLDDEAIAGGIIQAFEQSNFPGMDRIAVAVKDGIVQIDGVVSDIALMHTLIHIAQNTRGVRDVVNELLVRHSA